MQKWLMKFDVKRFVNEYWDLAILLLIVYIGFNIRSINVPDIVADYDPWWYYRHSVTVLKYWFDMPKWDILSFYPPGRPYEVHLKLHSWNFS
jgi:asparagine N-glycosylation enzyme membrane subunit Stt3